MRYRARRSSLQTQTEVRLPCVGIGESRFRVRFPAISVRACLLFSAILFIRSSHECCGRFWGSEIRDTSNENRLVAGSSPARPTLPGGSSVVEQLDAHASFLRSLFSPKPKWCRASARADNASPSDHESPGTHHHGLKPMTTFPNHPNQHHEIQLPQETTTR